MTVGTGRTPSKLDRRDAVAALVKERGDLLVVTGLGSTTYDVYAAGDHPGNFYLWGAMGGAAMVGLGLALAQPTRPVLVVTGDAEQMMGLGALATIGSVARPPNLCVCVIDNAHFGETGMQRSHTGLGVDLRAIARDCGFPRTLEVSDLAGVEEVRRTLEPAGGPTLAVIRVEARTPPRSLPSRDAVFLKDRFRSHLDLDKVSGASAPSPPILP